MRALEGEIIEGTPVLVPITKPATSNFIAIIGIKPDPYSLELSQSWEREAITIFNLSVPFHATP